MSWVDYKKHAAQLDANALGLISQIMNKHTASMLEVVAEEIKKGEKENAELKQEIKILHTVMMAAAVEITEHWASHCDSEGYGPVNLVRRLENGIASEYGYDAKTLLALHEKNDELKQRIAELSSRVTELEAYIYDLNIELKEARDSYETI